MIIGDLTTDFEDAEFPELWPTFGFNPNATGPTGNTVYGLCRGPQINGTLTNMDPATDWVRTERGLALDFDGSNDRVNTGNACPCDGRLPYSVFFRATINASGAHYPRIVSKESGTNYGMCIAAGPSGDRRIYFLRTGAEYVAVNYSIGVMYSLAMVYDGSVIYGYMDGIAIGSASSNTSVTTASSLWLGTHPVNLNACPQMLLYEVLCYSTPLHSSQVELLHRLGPGGWARRKSPTWYIPSGQAFIDHTSNILRLMSGGVL